MNSQLYIQFYVNKDSPIPFSSHKFNHTIRDGIGTSIFQENMGYDAIEWMLRHPLGKVEFVWMDWTGESLK